MIRVFLAEGQPETRSALRLLLLDLEMQVVGEADNWTAVLNEAALTRPDMIVVDWELIPADSSLLALRATCPTAVVIVLVSSLDARQQAALSAGADSFISKDETPDRVAERLRDAVANIPPPPASSRPMPSSRPSRPTKKTKYSFLRWLHKRNALLERAAASDAAASDKEKDAQPLIEPLIEPLSEKLSGL
jgi:DNA-binding NarL/FixJ family response regulator